MLLIELLCAAELAAVAVLLWVASRKQLFHFYPAAKAVASGGFLVLAAAVWLCGTRAQPGLWLLLFSGLALCAAGDVLLGFANLHGGAHGTLFRVGGVCFGLAHLIFCVRFWLQTTPRAADAAAVVLGGGAVWVLGKMDLIRLKKQKPMGILYGALVTLMCAKALDWWLVARSAASLLCGVGSVLFWLSDAVLIFMYFGTRVGERRRRLRTVNLSLYYAGVVLLALSGSR